MNSSTLPLACGYAGPALRSEMAAQNLDPGPCIGLGLSQSVDGLRFVLTAPAPMSPGLVEGQFLVALRAQSPQELVVLRLQQFEAWPEPGSPELQRCEGLLARQAEGLPPQWPLHGLAALRCEILGAYRLPAQMGAKPLFFSSVPLSEPPQAWQLHRATPPIMELLANGTVDPQARIELGLLRSSENLVYLDHPHPVHVSMLDIRGKRTAMFGKTRLGKSNVVKLVLQGMLDVTADDPHVGQIVFDVNGEYANVNPQDGDSAIAATYPERCIPYFLTDLGQTTARLLRFNFYERTEDALDVIRELLPPDIAEMAEVRNLLTVRLPPLVRQPDEYEVHFQRRLRKLMLFWAILDSAGFPSDSPRMKQWISAMGLALPFNPGFSQPLRKAAYLGVNNTPAPSLPHDFATMVLEMRVMARFSLAYPNDPTLSPNGQFVFDADEEIMVAFLCQSAGPGTSVLRPCLQFHSPTASDFTHEILESLDASKTVIINLGSANEQIIRYFARSICTSIFHHQERKFVRNQLAGRYVQIYFEEAHMIFPPHTSDVTNIYSRFAKEGAKFNIGIVYCTQSPTTVNRDLLSQTENFFIGHLSSETETAYLSAVQAAFKGCERPIMRNRTPGFMQVLMHSHRYVVPIQAHRYDGSSRRVGALPVADGPSCGPIRQPDSGLRRG